MKKEYSFFKSFFKPTTIIVCLFFVLLFFIFINSYPYYYDETSHWGLVVKNMFEFKDFGVGEFSTTAFKSYPPAAGVFHYFFQYSGKAFNGALLYPTMNIMNISLMLPILSLFKKDNIFKGILCAFTLAVFPFVNFFSFYRYIMVDALLPTLFAYSMFVYFRKRKFDKFTLINYTLSIYFLVLLKDTGFILAIFSLIIVAIDFLFLNKYQLKSYSSSKINVILLILPIIALFFSKYSWKLYLNINNVAVVWQDGFTFEKIIQYLSEPTEVQIKTTYKFVQWLFLPSANSKYLMLPILVNVIILAGLCFVYYKLSKNKKTAITLFSSLFFFYFCFLIGTLMIFLFNFNEYEGIRNASYSRYLCDFVYGAFLIFFYLIWSELSKRPDKMNTLKNKKVLATISLFTIVVSGYFTYLGIFSAIEKREKVEPLLPFENFCKTLDYKFDHVYYVNMYNHQQNIQLARMLATPVDCCGLKNPGSWRESPEEIFNEGGGDPFMPYVSVETLHEKLLKEYNYLYIDKINDEFVQKYGVLFENINEIKNNTAFKVIRYADNFTLELI